MPSSKSTDRSPSGEAWILVGRVVGAFGLAGELKLEPLTDFPQRFESGRSLYLGADRHQIAIEKSRKHKSHLLVKFAGVDSVEAAQRLLATEAFVPQSETIALNPDEYLFSELVGIEVQTSDGTKLGSITEVLRTGSNDVYVVGTGSRSILIPGVKDAIVELDIPRRRMVVEPWAAAPAI